MGFLVDSSRVNRFSRGACSHFCSHLRLGPSCNFGGKKKQKKTSRKYRCRLLLGSTPKIEANVWKDLWFKQGSLFLKKFWNAELHTTYGGNNDTLLVEVEFHQQKYGSLGHLHLHFVSTPSPQRGAKKNYHRISSKWWGNVEPTLRPRSDCQESSWSSPTAVTYSAARSNLSQTLRNGHLAAFFQLKNAAF